MRAKLRLAPRVVVVLLFAGLLAALVPLGVSAAPNTPASAAAAGAQSAGKNTSSSEKFEELAAQPVRDGHRLRGTKWVPLPRTMQPAQRDLAFLAGAPDSPSLGRERAKSGHDPALLQVYRH